MWVVIFVFCTCARPSGIRDTLTICRLVFSFASIRFASKTSYEELKESNIIYVGPFHKRQKFTTLFNASNLHFKITEDILQMTNVPNNKDITIDLEDTELDMEYAICNSV